MKRTEVSLKWLRVFRGVAQSGSIQRTAEKTGHSVSAVSHQLQALEDHLGVALVDHSRRPMTLTTRGVAYLRYTEEILELLERASAEIVSDTPSSLRQLSFAMIDDFESDVGPEIVRMLTTALPACRLISYTRPSHEILTLLRDRELDIGIATQPQTPIAKVEETPILRDPFVLAVPAVSHASGEEFVTSRSGLPFLRYSRDQIMGRMIDAQLARLRLPLKASCEFDSTASIMALVAEGHGWAITTPATFSRSKRFRGQIKLLPFPRQTFARTISVFLADPQAGEAARSVATALRSLLSIHTIAPMVLAYPWLGESYRLFASPTNA